MPMIWTDAESGDVRDAYLDFAWMTRQRRRPTPGADIYEPVFVRLRSKAGRAALLAQVDEPAAPLLMEPFERAVLSARTGATDPDEGLADEYALYRRLGTRDADHAKLFEVLDTGTPVGLTPSETPEAAAMSQSEAPAPKGAPIVAIIDDGIGFLNARFRKTPQTTRFHAVWLQALERSGPAKSTHLGEVLSRAEIDALLARGPALDEAAIYAETNARLIRHNARRSTEHGTSHGTHMLDLAAGADPDNTQGPARDWPLLAVQLPPQAIEDTSGARFESYMVQALRWCLRRAEEIDPTAPVIVNLSMGMLAGPKDGTRFAEYQIAREAEQWERVKGQPVRVVWSFGNDYLGRLVSGFSYPATETRSATDTAISWIVQPGDHTESFMELRAGKGQSLDDLEIALTPPVGPGSGHASVPQGQWRSLMAGQSPVARIYHVAQRALDTATVQRDHLVLALAPTESCHAEPLAPAGTWTVHLRYRKAAALDVTLQIQRDESLVGYRERARQSYFDSREAYGWADGTQAYSALEGDCPIRHAGSHSAMVTAPARQVFSAGAAWYNAEIAQYLASDYSSEGADWSVPGPTVATVADRSRTLSGIAGTGTLTGSARAINGTSAAAARLTRALALSAQKVTANAKNGGGTQVDDFDWAEVSGWAVPTAQTARLGRYVITTEQTAP